MIEVWTLLLQKGLRQLLLLCRRMKIKVFFQYSAHDHTQLSSLNLSSTIRPCIKQIIGRCEYQFIRVHHSNIPSTHSSFTSSPSTSSSLSDLSSLLSFKNNALTRILKMR